MTERIQQNVYLAIDFGGGSGRVMAGKLTDGKLELEEIHRFANRQVRLGNHVYWDFPALFEDMKDGLKAAARKGYHVKGIGIDTWGVDFGLIDAQGNLLGNPVCYRDARTQGTIGKVFHLLDRQQHYATTGIQVMEINTLFQLYSMKEADDPRLHVGHRLLFMPDLFSYYLTGVANNEYCIASTSELLDVRTRNWSWETIRALGLPEHLFGPIVTPGTIRGTLREELARETGLGPVNVIAVGSHDTASAVAAVPCTDTPVAFLSSGTWSLLGVETETPILTEEARKAEFTNEGTHTLPAEHYRTLVAAMSAETVGTAWRTTALRRYPATGRKSRNRSHHTGRRSGIHEPRQHGRGYHDILPQAWHAGTTLQSRDGEMCTAVAGMQICTGSRATEPPASFAHPPAEHHRRRLTECPAEPAHRQPPGHTGASRSGRSYRHGQRLGTGHGLRRNSLFRPTA